MHTRELNENEADGHNYYKQWTNDIINRGFGLDYTLNGTEEDLEYLDLVLKNGPYTENVEDELTILGSVLGNIIENTLEMKWVVLTDEYGTAFALEHAKEVYTYPQELLLKRAEEGTLGTVSEVYYSVVEVLKEEIEAKV